MTDVTAGWANFFIATAGAAGALVGLVIVAISVSIRTIIEFKSLPSRAAAGIGSLVLLLVIACFSLFPHQSAVVFAIEIAASTAAALAQQIVMTVRLVQGKRPWTEGAYKVVLGIGQLVPFFVGSALLVSHDATGMYWVGAGYVAVFITSMITVWVLLVEIQR
jgi:hypothetical protein